MSKIDFGYPQSENKIYPSDIVSLELLRRSVIIPAQLEAFYRECGGITLNDVWNGYHIYTPAMILKGIEIGEPTRTIGSINSEIMSFGSDIGGHRLAIMVGVINEVLYLPHGILENGVFEETTRIKVITTDFFGFLDRLLDDTKAYVRRVENWSYMDNNLYDR